MHCISSLLKCLYLFSLNLSFIQKEFLWTYGFFGSLNYFEFITILILLLDVWLYFEPEVHKFFLHLLSTPTFDEIELSGGQFMQ